MNEQDIPIEISSTKLLDWLESRKIVPKNWQTQIREIRAKISQALNDMPVHNDLVKLLSGEYINYFHCLQIVEILKTTEADTKSLFGRYGSQRMTDWKEIVRLYERDAVYLAEAAQIYLRNNTEVPSLRKQRTKITQLIDDTHQRIRDLVKSEENVLAERSAICQQLGIRGQHLRDEFMERIRELPKLYNNVSEQVANLLKAIELYAEFSGNAEVLPLLRHISMVGNTTVYQYVYGEVPTSIEESVLSIYLSPENDCGAGTTENEEIDFGGGGNGGEINFGDNNVDGEIDFGEFSVEDGGSSIDWGVSADAVIQNVTEISLEESGIVVADRGHDSGVARGEQAYTVLDSPVHRDQFFDELYELESFLQMRQYELKSDQANSFLFSIIDGNTKQDENTIGEMLAKVECVLNAANSELIDHLHRLKHSNQYADILAGRIQQLRQTAEKMKATRSICKDKIDTLTDEKQRLRPIIIKLIDGSKTLQTNIETDISKRYRGRVVSIYGGVDYDSMDK